MQDIIVYAIVGLAAALAIIGGVKRFFGKKGGKDAACEGCALKGSCNKTNQGKRIKTTIKNTP